MKQLIVSLVLPLCLFSCKGNRGDNPTGESGVYRKVIELTSAAGNRRDTLDLGNMRSGEEVVYDLGVRNADTAAMVILDVRAGCGCTSPEYDRQPILPGDTARVRLLYDSSGQSGVQMKSIQLITTLGEKPHTVYLTADVQHGAGR
jgi:hypothetical protein